MNQLQKILEHLKYTPVEAKLSQTEVKDIYNKMSRFYDIWGILVESKARARTLSMAEIQGGEHILEMAVGTGIAFEKIVAANPDGVNIGLDLSEGMLQEAQYRLRGISGNYELKPGTAFDIPYPENSFDVLFNHYMFDLIPFDEMDSILSEFKRVLKPGGKLLLANMTPGRSPASRIYNLIYRISPKLFGGCRSVQMADELESGDFSVQRYEYVEQLFFPTEVILARA